MKKATVRRPCGAVSGGVSRSGALALAAFRGHCGVLRRLLAEGLPGVAQAAARAAAAGEAEALQLLRPQAVGGKRSLLHAAAGAGHTEAGGINIKRH